VNSKDTNNILEKNIPFTGRLITSVNSAFISDGDFSSITNFHYTPSGIKAIKGMSMYSQTTSSTTTYISSHVSTISDTGLSPSTNSKIYAHQTYPSGGSFSSSIIFHNALSNMSSYTDIRVIASYWTSSTAYKAGQVVVPSATYSPHSRPSYYLECITAGTSDSSYPSSANTALYDTDIIDGTVKWVKRKGDLVGKFTKAPDETIVFTNGHHNLIYGGQYHRVGMVLNTLPSSSLYNNITEHVTNKRADDIYCATISPDSDTSIYIDIGSPLKLRGVTFYLKTPNTNTNATISCYRYTESGWENASSVTDGTNRLSQTGTVSFAFSNDDINNVESSDIPNYYYSTFLYWYRVELTPSSGTLGNVTLYLVTGKTIIQEIPGMWDGSIYTPLAFYYMVNTNYNDGTIEVSRRENSLVYISNGWYIVQGTGVGIGDGDVNEMYVGSAFPCSGIKFFFPYLDFNPKGKTFGNTAASTISVYYWNGSAWTAVSNLVDGTSNGTSTLNKEGVISFRVPDGSEKKTIISTNVPLYYYKLLLSTNPSTNTAIDCIELIPRPSTVKSYYTSTIWNNRLVLAGSRSNPNEIVFSAPNSPYIWQGDQYITLYVGDNSPIINIVSLFTRYGSDIQETLVVFKENSVHVVVGSSKEDIKIYTVSNNTGCIASTVQTCGLGIRLTEGINKAVVIFADVNNIYMFDNSAIISISDDITPDISGSKQWYTSAYDPVNSWYHFFFHNGTKVNEYVFDLIYKKWFTISRTSPLSCILYDNGNMYGTLYSGTYTGSVVTLNSGYTMLGSSYSASFTTAIKPLNQNINFPNTIRRFGILTYAPSNTALSTTITSDLETDNFSLTITASSTFISHCKSNDINVRGTFFNIYCSFTISNQLELGNINLLYHRLRNTI